MLEQKVKRLPQLIKKRWIKKLGRVAFAVTVYSIVIVLNQDLLIFPGAVKGLFYQSNYSAPPEVKEHFLATAEGYKLNIWELAAKQEEPIKKKKVAVIFHGNGGDMRKFFEFQKWFSLQGYSSYNFDYRGYGKSTGWMNEKRIYQDGESVLKFVSERETIPLNNVAILGISIGSGPAAYTAQLFQSKILLIASGYSSLPEVARTRPIIGLLAPFLRYEFPTASYLEKLNHSCVVLSHGQKDEVIPYENSQRLMESASKNNTVHFVSSEVGRHNDTFWEKSSEIKEALRDCSN